MPRNPKYPLTALREHRERKVDTATAELGGAVRARTQASAAKDEAERLQGEAEARAEAVRSDEAARLLRGAASAGDLARSQAWEHGVRAELSGLARERERAVGRLADARDAEDASRVALVASTVDRDVVAKDEERFAAEVRREQATAEDEANEEMVAARSNTGRCS